MRLIKPSHRILTGIDQRLILARIEATGRTAYKSEARITKDSAEQFVRRLIIHGHESVLEHEQISVRFICDRGGTHELVRHRLAAYTQESTRYCNYSGGVTFIIPPWVDIDPDEYNVVWDGVVGRDIRATKGGRVPPYYDDAASWWFWHMAVAERDYRKLLECGWTPQQARSVLPNSLKTEIIMTANLREWRHVLRLRTASDAHPQMREIMIPLLREFHQRIPVLFDDIAA